MGDVSEMHETREALLKARVIGDGAKLVPLSNVAPTDEERSFIGAGALPPPYDPYTLCMLYEHSNALRQNIDAYVTNIDAFGHRYEPVLDLNAPDLVAQVRQAMERGVPSDMESASDDEVRAKIKEIAATMRDERATLEAFFSSCCLDSSFVSLRRKTRQDIELIGNGYWEVLRNAGGEIAQFVYVPGFTMRLMPLDAEPTVITQRVRTSATKYEEITVRKRFRRFVQLYETRMVHFKEFGDPRTMSARTGRHYDSLDAMRKDEGDAAILASEAIHFRIHSPRSPYGVPRWIGNLLAVLGSRQAEEVNYLYFDNKSVPPLALLVSGGRISDDTVKRLQDFVETEIKGKKNFHKILVLDADAGGAEYGAGGRMRIQIQPLTGSQHNDALFQNYDERNIDKIGMAFRLPRLLRGDIRDFNRGTADAAIAFAESQVFAPEREEFDFTLNRHILPALGVRYWSFRSNAPTLRDPAGLAPILTSMVQANILTGAEARQLAEGVFNRELRFIDDEWTEKPPGIYLTELQMGMTGGGGAGDEFAEPEAEPEGEEPEAETPASPAPRAEEPGPEEELADVAPGVRKGAPSDFPRLTAAQLRKLRRLPPAMLKQAWALLTLRDALRAAEAEQADKAFRKAKAAKE